MLSFRTAFSFSLFPRPAELQVQSQLVIDVGSALDVNVKETVSVHIETILSFCTPDCLQLVFTWPHEVFKSFKFIEQKSSPVSTDVIGL